MRTAVMRPRWTALPVAGTAVLLALALLGAAPPADPLVAQQRHLGVVHTFEAWDVRRGEGAVVAVLDTGVDLDHPDLAGRLVEGIDLVEPGTPPDDPQGHGTLVAGVIVAVAGNGRGVTGAAPQAKVMPIRVLDADGLGTSDILADGIRRAVAAGVQVINLSLAEVTPDEEDPSAGPPAPGLLGGLSLVQDDDVVAAIREADDAGILVVAAAGNDGRDRTPYAPETPVLVVGATDEQGFVWEESNHDARTLFAPGVAILSTWSEQRYARADGTSFATPIVASGAAMLLGAGLDVDATLARLTGTAVPVGQRPPDQPTADPATPSSSGTPPPVAQGEEVGLGRVDLAAAVQGVDPAPPPTDLPPPPPPPAGPPPAQPPPPTGGPGGGEGQPQEIVEVLEAPPPAPVVTSPPAAPTAPASVTTAPGAVAALEPVQPVPDPGVRTDQGTPAPGAPDAPAATGRGGPTTAAVMVLGADVLLAGVVLRRRAR